MTFTVSPLVLPTTLFHISFYKFVALTDSAATTLSVRDLASRHALEGLIDVAAEGISGAVSGSADALNAFELTLTTATEFKNSFAGIAFKRTACKSKPFHSLKVSHVPELIKIGLSEEINKTVDTTQPHGVSLSPQAWRDLLEQDDVVVIDNRNSFEFELGRFKGAIDPKVAHYRDFPKFIEDSLPTWKAQGKRVAMYCTGGIRCEKTAAWMATFDTNVYTLEGGIINYLDKMKDATNLDQADQAAKADEAWSGECFVFDNRIALDANLVETDTDIEDVYDEERDGAWRIQRAKRLAGRSD